MLKCGKPVKVMEKSIILKQIEKGESKFLNNSKKALYKALESETVKNLSFNISLLASYYEALIPELNKRYDMDHPTSNTDRKAVLMKLFKQNSPILTENGKVAKAIIIQQTNEYTDYRYELRDEFNLRQVYNIVLSARKKEAEIVSLETTYRKYKNIVLIPDEKTETAPETAPAPEKKKRERKPKNQAAWSFSIYHTTGY